MIWALIFLVFAGLECHGHNEEKMKPYYEGCFQSKGCFGYPYKCAESEDCDFLLSYVDNGNGVLFQLSGILEFNSYMAMGLSLDERMGGDAVTECFWQGPKDIVQKSWNMPKGNRNRIISEKPKNHSAEVENGIHSCSWVDDYSFDIKGINFNLVNSAYHILLANGPMEPLTKKLKHSHKIASREAVNLTAYKSILESQKENIPTEDPSKDTEFVGSVSKLTLKPELGESTPLKHITDVSAESSTLKSESQTNVDELFNIKSLNTKPGKVLNDSEVSENLNLETDRIGNSTSRRTSKDFRFKNHTQSVKVQRRNIPLEDFTYSTIIPDDSTVNMDTDINKNSILVKSFASIKLFNLGYLALVLAITMFWKIAF